MQWENTCTFYGQRFDAQVIDGLRLQMRRGTQDGRGYDYIVFFKAHGGRGVVYYRIEPVRFGPVSKPYFLRLQKRFLLQSRSTMKTISVVSYTNEALGDLFETIRAYEREGAAGHAASNHL